MLRGPIAGRWMLFAIAFALRPDTAAAELTLERVVLVSRHGVRAPTDSTALMHFTNKKWPDWPVGDSCLTPRGKMLASLMGAFYAREFAGVLARPPKESEVFILADIDQRTRETAAGLHEGIFSSPKLTDEQRNAEEKGMPGERPAACKSDSRDPLFHPVTGICRIDLAKAHHEIKKAAGGDINVAQQRLAKSVDRLKHVLGQLDPATSSIVENDDKDSIRLKGPIAVGSTASEVFLLEYAQRFPHDQVAWGLASTPEKLMPLLRLHDLQFALLQRTRHLARRQGSALLAQVLETLRQTAEGRSDPLRPVPQEAKLVIYVGHDTNLANLGGILRADWKLLHYVKNETPPAGAMAFELLRDSAAPAGKQYFVRMAYYSQTLTQMRDATDLTGKEQPDKTAINLACEKKGRGACAWVDFDKLVRRNWDAGCLRPKAN
jgi:4-phytase / acid phosphatase